MSEIKVMVTGACGKMGREVVKAVAARRTCGWWLQSTDQCPVRT